MKCSLVQRISERRNVTLVGLMQYLNFGRKYNVCAAAVIADLSRLPNKSSLFQEAKIIIKRLFCEKDESLSNSLHSEGSPETMKEKSLTLSEDSKSNETTEYFPRKNPFNRSLEAGVKVDISECRAGNSLPRRQSKAMNQGSSSDDLPPRRCPQNSLFSFHLKDLLQDNNTFSTKDSENPNDEYSFKSAKHNGAVPKQTATSMPLNGLQDLIEKSPEEILCTILDKESGFILALRENFNRDSIAYILISLGKAVSSDINKDIATMLNIISSNNNLFLVNVQQYLVSFQAHKPDGFHLDAVVCLIRFLLKFQMCLPSNACDVLIMLLPLLKETCERHLSQNDEMYSEAVGILQELEELNASLLNKYTLNQIKEKSRNEKLQLLDPPEDYRSIPILPNEVDIQQPCAFLRPSVIKGQYQNTGHYLDVQYRLLREDYVRPLREGITEYLSFKDNNKSLKRIKDIKVYPHVQIIKQEFVNGELLHMAHINDKKFAKIKWEFSKRLLSKSLLCLSSDNFKTMLFATVARRDPKELTKGLLFLRFEELTDEVLNLDPSRNFVVIETSAYFEAYRYNLDALLELKDDTLPMKRYIVETQKTVLKPQYLNDTVSYDMRPVLLPLSEASRRREISADGKICSDYIYPSNVPERLKNVTVLNDSLWPTCSDLNLDPSQYAALKAAITKEFAIIQGPPGTGKTYVGLRIAQLLLHNVDKWRSKIYPSPILVICYTNHALDQFLEGILTFTKKIVRIGGRGNNEAISSFQINNLKRNMSHNKELPRNIVCSTRYLMDQLRSLKNSVDEAKQSIESSFTSILSEEILKKCMTSHHYYSLKSKEPIRLRSRHMLIYEWLLGIKVQEGNASASVRQTLFAGLNFRSSLPDDDEEFFSARSDADSEEEADIDHIEAQRDINPDEFAGASYDIPLYKDKLDSIIGLDDGWQFVGGKQGLKDYVYECLSYANPMNVKIARKIKDVWALSYESKWSLYKFWLEVYIRKKNEHITELHQQIRKKYNELQEMRTLEDIHVCKQALVVGMTTTGAAKYRHIVQRLNPRIVIVEEAAEILESHIVTSLARGTQHLILIGDHQQLRPSPTVHLLATKYGMNISLFERMIENGLDCYKLEIQHRMRPEIASLLVPHIYTKLHNHESVETFEDIKGVAKNLFFVNHSYYELQENDSKSKVNVHEATFMLKFCKYLIMQGYKPSEITVLTTYSGQLFEFKRSPLKTALQGVRFTVVDNFQGEESDIILISFVRSNEEGQIGFLKISNRVCVALSRAKKGLYCIGNFNLLAEKSNLWKNIIKTLEDNEAIGPSLLLMCQNHPDTSRVVTNDSDFDLVPEGGCTQKCEFRLLCGHQCSLKCHPYDPKHEDIQCPKPCAKQCSEGHVCAMKCYEQCPPCAFPVPKTIELCGHTIQVPCHRLKKVTPCTEPCEKLLPCGHQCRRNCGEPCTEECFVKVPITSSVCSHEVNIECSRSKDLELMMMKCQEPCGAELPCGHKCKGKCGNCYQGRLHVICMEPCTRILICGHTCKSVCYRNCPPCKETCEKYCVHKKCPKQCGEPCEKCTEPCEWSCSHKKCTRLCGELCDRTICNEPCPKILKCKHPCIGVCGERCPTECRTCDKEEGCFGCQVETDAMFVCLEDCRHTFEVNGFRQWMTKNNPERNEIRLKTCPTCNTVIRNSLHFERNAEFCVEKVKNAVSGNKDYNDNLKEVLHQRIRKERIGSFLGLTSSSTFRAGWSKLKEALESGKRRDIQDLSTMENVMNIMKIWPSCSTSLLSDFAMLVSRSNIYYQINKKMAEKLKDYMNVTEKWLDSFITKRFLIASEQQLKDLLWEVHRLKLVDELGRLMMKVLPDGQSYIYMNKLMHLVLNYSPFREPQLIKFISELQNVSKYVPNSSINVSELQKQPVLTIMSLSDGHWFLCEKGHAYSVVKCSNTTQESKCYECDRKIIDLKSLLPKPHQPPKPYQPPKRPTQHRDRRPRVRRS
ncbi:NFX1-type zinc finger-containing protein 1 [Araneus ventricosus]|uniref:NFX1-type zinc finger-containing protein 1 n=1 Tax=Araneus ventricosus TaxID=182803 RepID=A0A4Y2AXP0_ARAVE|nr:NFX1-type zinc finger-containing protein 1 [Araneus ventricosus]